MTWTWEKRYDNFLALGAIFSVFYYGVPAALILAGMVYFGVADKYWTPVLLIYSLGAIAHMLNFGFMASNIQMKVIADRAFPIKKT